MPACVGPAVVSAPRPARRHLAESSPLSERRGAPGPPRAALAPGDPWGPPAPASSAEPSHLVGAHGGLSARFRQPTAGALWRRGLSLLLCRDKKTSQAVKRRLSNWPFHRTEFAHRNRCPRRHPLRVHLHPERLVPRELSLQRKSGGGGAHVCACTSSFHCVSSDLCPPNPRLFPWAALLISVK